MKRIIAILLSIITVCVGMTAYASDYDEHKYENAIVMLSDFGIMNGYEDGTFRPDASITRAEFATLAIRAAGYDNIAQGKENEFKDIPNGAWYLGYANFANSMGYMTGFDDGTFGGEKNVTLNQAIKTMVNVLGYEKIAEQIGGYPQGHIAVANALDMLKGITTGETAATRGEIAQLIANSLTAVAADTKLGDNASVDYGDEMLIETLGYGVYTGKVEAVNGLALDKQFDSLGVDEVVIGGQKFKTTVSDMTKFFGLTVKFYLYEGKNGAVPEVRHAYALDGSYLTIDADDIKPTTTTSQVDYYDGTKIRKAKIDGATFVYNGKALMTADITNSVLIPKDGTVTLIDVNDDDNYDTVLIWEYDNIVVKSIADEKIYGLYEQVLTIPDDEASVTAIYNGNKASLSDIKIGDVVSAYVSKDGGYARLIISRNETEGIYTSKGSDYIVLDNGEKLKMSALYEILISSNSTRIDAPDFGDNAVYKLDATGKIASVEISEQGSGATQYGYIISVATEGIDDEGYVKFLNHNNEFETLPIASGRKLRLGYMDDITYTVKRVGFTELETILKNGETTIVKQLMKYSVTDGVLTEIYLVDKNGSGNSWYENVIESEMRVYSGKLVGDDYIVDDETVAFYIPNGGTLEDYRSGNAVQLMSNGSSMRSLLYDVRNKHVECIVLIPMLTVTSGNKYVTDVANDTLMIITDVSYKVDDEGEIKLMLSGYTDGKIEEVLVRDVLENNSEPLENLKPGALIQYKMNTEELKYAETADNIHCMILFRTIVDFTQPFADEILWNGEQVEQTNSVMRTLKGTITYVDGPNVIIDVDGTEWPVVLTDYASVVEYNDVDSMRTLTADDLAEGQRVFIRQRYNNTREIIIVK